MKETEYMLEQMFQSIIELDRSSVVICTPDHVICYMNPAAIKNYTKRGGQALIGRSLLDCHNPESCRRIREVLAWFQEDPEHRMIHTGFNPKQNKDLYMVALRDSNGTLLGYYEKQEFRNPEEAPCYDYSRSLV